MADKLFTVKVDFSDAAKVLENHGLEKGGRVQAFFTNEVMRRSDPYVPFSSGPLKNTARITADMDGIVYNQPYSRFHWYGKVMIYEPTGSTWAPKYGEKVVTDRDMEYQGAPLRGPKWVERSWLDNKYDIIRSTEEFARKIK